MNQEFSPAGLSNDGGFLARRDLGCRCPVSNRASIHEVFRDRISLIQDFQRLHVSLRIDRTAGLPRNRGEDRVREFRT